MRPTRDERCVPADGKARPRHERRTLGFLSHAAIATACAIALFLVVGCSGNESSGPALVTRTETELVRQPVGAEGAVIESGLGFSLTIPAGALTSEIEITISEVTDLSTVKLPPNARLRSDRVFVIGPPNLKLAKPARATVPVLSSTSVDPTREITVLYRASPRTNLWEASSVTSGFPFQMAVNIEHARDLVIAAVDTSCIPAATCFDGGAQSCSIGTSTQGVRCAGNTLNSNVECKCTASSDVVAVPGTMPIGVVSEPFFKGLAMICGVACTGP